MRTSTSSGRSALSKLLIGLEVTLISLSVNLPAPGQGPGGSPAGGGISGLKEFTSSANFVVPPRVTHLLVELWGAGGGGAGGGVGNSAAGGGGAGGGGGYSRGVIAVSAGQTISVTVGGGGQGGAVGTNGSDGGDSKLVVNGTVLIFAAGGKGGATGLDLPSVDCSTLSGNYSSLGGGAGGAGGLGDPSAAISRGGSSGSPGTSASFGGCEGQDCVAFGPGDGAKEGGWAISGSITPPGSRGGAGGNGKSNFGTPFPCAPANTRPEMPATAGTAGSGGYILLMW